MWNRINRKERKGRKEAAKFRTGKDYNELMTGFVWRTHQPKNMRKKEL